MYLDVSRHDIAGIWVAFFSRPQRYRCGQGRASSMLPVDFAQSHPDAAAALVGRRLWWPSNYDDVPGASPLERAYTQFGPTDANNEVLHLK